MENKDLNISEMIKMQKELHEINKERWGEYYPEDAKNHLWDEIRMKKLYRRKIVVRDCNGKFDQTIQ